MLNVIQIRNIVMTEYDTKRLHDIISEEQTDKPKKP